MEDFIEKPKGSRLKNILSLIMIAIISIGALYLFYQRKVIQKANQALEILAATTISTNISTDGTLSVGGSATTSGSFYIANDLTISSGNVGVGTTTPDALLDIGKTAASHNNLFMISSSTAGDLLTVDRSGNVTAVAFVGDGSGLTDISAAWTESGNDTYRTTGNVGIGDTSPASLLEISSTTADTAMTFTSGAGSWTMGMDYSNRGYFTIASSTALGTNDRMIIDNDGNVGIGTTTPDAVLSVTASAGSLTGNQMLFTVASTTRATINDYLVVTADGNIGLSTTTPTARLEIRKTSGSGIKVLSKGSSSWTSIDIGRLESEAQWGIVGEANNFFLEVNPGDAIIRLSDTSQKLHLGVGNATSPEITITEANVGIATTTPTARLEVKKVDGAAIKVLSAGATDWTTIDIGRTGGEAQWGIVGEANNFFLGTAPGDVIMRVDDSSKKLHLGITSGGTSPEITITEGNVGIATTTPNALFSVYSTATTTAFFDSGAAAKGACLKFKDVDGGGYTYCYLLDGAMSCSTDSCE